MDKKITASILGKMDILTKKLPPEVHIKMLWAIIMNMIADLEKLQTFHDAVTKGLSTQLEFMSKREDEMNKDGAKLEAASAKLMVEAMADHLSPDLLHEFLKEVNSHSGNV